MSRTTLFRLALAGVMMIAGGVTSARAESAKQPPDLSGEWRLDPSKSDTPGRPSGGGLLRGPRMGGRGGGGFPGGREDGGRGGWGRADEGSGGGQRMRVPDFMRIVESAGFVRLEDSSGTALREIATRGGAADTTSLPSGVPRLLGEWKGDRLEVKHENARGGTITETYALDGKGRSLVLTTKFEGRRTFEFKRVYERVDAR